MRDPDFTHYQECLNDGATKNGDGIFDGISG